MNLLYATLFVIVVYPGFGTLLLALLPNLQVSIKLKILILTFIHPALTALFIWLVFSPFNRDIAQTGVVLTCGSYLGIFSSRRKYYLNLVKETGSITIEYFTQILKRKVVKIDITEIKEFSQSRSKRIIDQPSELEVTLDSQTLTFTILDKQMVPSL